MAFFLFRGVFVVYLEKITGNKRFLSISAVHSEVELFVADRIDFEAIGKLNQSGLDNKVIDLEVS